MKQAKGYTVEASWGALLKDLGMRPADVLRRAGLPEDLLSRRSASLSTADYMRFWGALEETSNDPLFPLRLADTFTAEAFSPWIFAALCSPNLEVAVRRLARFKPLVLPMSLDVDAPDGALVIGPRWLGADAVPLSLVAFELAFFVRLARLGTREAVRAAKVVMPSVPEPGGPFESYFGVRVQRGSTPRIEFSPSDAERPFLTANESVWKVFEPDLRRQLSELGAVGGLGERVRAILLEVLPGGQSSMEFVAARLAMSKRTLQRRLNEEGTTFQAVVNRTREVLARHYLTSTSVPLSEIAFLLGFEDPNSFFRAFQTWTGSSPERTRQSADR